MKIKIKKIINIENINVTESGINQIIRRSNGDMRKVLNILQSTSMAYDVVDEANVNKCIGYPSSKHIKAILKSLLHDDFQKSHMILSTIRTENVYSLRDVVTEISTELIQMIMNGKVSHDTINLLTIISKLAEIEYNLSSCSMENLQLSALVAAFKILA